MNIQAILFDLNHTITKNNNSPFTLFKEISTSFGVDLQDATDEDLKKAFKKSDRWLSEYCIRQNVGPYWGGNQRIGFKQIG